MTLKLRGRKFRIMTAMEDDEMAWWLREAQIYGGSFIKAIAEAGVRADDDNYAILRPVLLQLKDKYPKYGHMQEKV